MLSVQRGCSFLLFRARELHEVGFDEAVEIAVHNSVYVGGLESGAVVFDAAVVENIAAYLRAPLDFHLPRLDLGLFFQTVVHLLLIKDGAQVAQGVLAVLGLVAGLGVFNQDLLFLAGIGVGVLVAQTHTRFHLVDVLAAGTTGAESVPRHQRRLNLHLDSVVNQGGDKHRRE